MERVQRRRNLQEDDVQLFESTLRPPQRKKPVREGRLRQ